MPNSDGQGKEASAPKWAKRRKKQPGAGGARVIEMTPIRKKFTGAFVLGVGESGESAAGDDSVAEAAPERD